MSRLLATLIFCLATFFAVGQSLQGIVTDPINNRPLAGASVYFNNSSIGTTTREDGSFRFSELNGLKNDLIISALSFKRIVFTYAQWSAGNLKVTLQPEVKELESIVLEPYESKGWEKWGKFFLDNLLGTTEFADDCRLTNPDVVRFRNRKKQNELMATAREPLLLRNRYLGYELKYELESFQYNFQSRILFYSGYAFFTPMQAKNARQQRQWEAHRLEAYQGSSMHFLRSVYRNQIQENGFSVYRMKKVAKPESEFAGSKGRLTFSVATVGAYPNAFKDSIYSKALPGDSIAYAHDSITAALDFPDYLVVSYPAKEPDRFAQQFMRPPYPYRQSQLILHKENPVLIQANGQYSDTDDLLMLGFWGWQEKLSSLLPVDYKPVAAAAK